MRLEDALSEVVGFLEERQVPYMVIGGFANLFWGRSRLTRDLDLTLSCPQDRLVSLVEDLRQRFRVLPADPLEFARRNRVLPVRVGEVRVDLVLAGLPYEEAAIRRARVVDVGGRPIRVCSPEDLIIHKIISDRPQDWEDVREIVRRQGKALDRRYMDPIVAEFSRVLERPDIISFYKQCFRGIERRGPELS
ncbi:MAG: nucleotidyl transferase AbiEii/AbiGii toxin family protein [Bacillota bacterium]|nr:nucleotidyl transferase AbiEii/AbiGii toxin family protein [Bacillota bacterium]